MEKNCIPDFIFAIGDDTSDEEMFNYLNSVHNQLSFYNEVFLKINFRVLNNILVRLEENRLLQNTI